MIPHTNICDAAETLWHYRAVHGEQLEPLFEATGLGEAEVDHAIAHAVELGLIQPGNGNLISFSIGILMGLLIIGKHLQVEEGLSPQDEFALLNP